MRREQYNVLFRLTYIFPVSVVHPPSSYLCHLISRQYGRRSTNYLHPRITSLVFCMKASHQGNRKSLLYVYGRRPSQKSLSCSQDARFLMRMSNGRSGMSLKETMRGRAQHRRRQSVFYCITLSPTKLLECLQVSHAIYSISIIAFCCSIGPIKLYRWHLVVHRLLQQ